MGMIDKSGSSFAVNGLNAILRLLQLAFAAVVVGIYAEAMTHREYNASEDVSKDMNLAIAAGAITIITSVIFGVVPFLISYYYIAIAFLWDWIVFFIWCAVFAVQRRYWGDDVMVAYLKQQKAPSVDALVAGQWFVLGAMLLVLCSAVMSPVCLFLDRNSLKGGSGSRAGV